MEAVAGRLPQGAHRMEGDTAAVRGQPKGGLGCVGDTVGAYMNSSGGAGRLPGKGSAVANASRWIIYCWVAKANGRAGCSVSPRGAPECGGRVGDLEVGERCREGALGPCLGVLGVCVANGGGQCNYDDDKDDFMDHSEIVI